MPESSWSKGRDGGGKFDDRTQAEGTGDAPFSTRCGGRLAANFDAVLNPEDRLFDGKSLAAAAEGCDAIMCAAGDVMSADTIAALPA